MPKYNKNIVKGTGIANIKTDDRFFSGWPGLFRQCYILLEHINFIT